jgi:hypothetical protein
MSVSHYPVGVCRRRDFLESPADIHNFTRIASSGLWSLHVEGQAPCMQFFHQTLSSMSTALTALHGTVHASSVTVCRLAAVAFSSKSNTDTDTFQLSSCSLEVVTDRI